MHFYNKGTNTHAYTHTHVHAIPIPHDILWAAAIGSKAVVHILKFVWRRVHACLKKHAARALRDAQKQTHSKNCTQNQKQKLTRLIRERSGIAAKSTKRFVRSRRCPNMSTTALSLLLSNANLKSTLNACVYLHTQCACVLFYTPCLCMSYTLCVCILHSQCPCIFPRAMKMFSRTETSTDKI